MSFLFQNTVVGQAWDNGVRHCPLKWRQWKGRGVAGPRRFQNPVGQTQVSRPGAKPPWLETARGPALRVLLPFPSRTAPACTEQFISLLSTCRVGESACLSVHPSSERFVHAGRAPPGVTSSILWASHGCPRDSHQTGGAAVSTVSAGGTEGTGGSFWTRWGERWPALRGCLHFCLVASLPDPDPDPLPPTSTCDPIGPA